jgi:hypothetical protein
MRKKLFLATAAVAVAATAGAGIVFAAGAVGSRGGPSVTAVGGGTGSGCGTIFQTRTDKFAPTFYQEDEADQEPASSLSFVKKCNGGLMATFSSEVAADFEEPTGGPSTEDVNNDDIWLYVRATCVGGLPGVVGHCATGSVQYANPGGSPTFPSGTVFFDDAPDIYETHSMQFAFNNLGAGHWRVDVVPIGPAIDSNSFLEYRTLFLETL